MNDLSAQRPVAKQIGILVEELGDETVLYDPSTNRFVSLNPAACFVWRRCDGSASVREITAALEHEHGLDDGGEVVWLAVRLLAAEDLLEHDVELPVVDGTEDGGRAMSRRTMLGMAAAGVAVPVVASLLAPTPASALSGSGSGSGTPTPPPTVDCEVSAWSDWSGCDVPCGGGTKTRTRTVVTPASGGGTPCPTLVQSQSCNDQPCPVDCVVSAWSSWSACDAACGGGTQTRTRTVITYPRSGGAPCPTLVDSQVCNTQPCP